MKINNAFSLIGKIVKNNEDNILIPGKTIEGKLLDKVDNIIKIQLNNGDIINAESKIPLKASHGNKMKFLVKNINKETIILNPINDKNYVNNSQRTLVESILEKNNLSSSIKNEEIIKNMLKLNMHVNNKKINNILKMTSVIEKVSTKLLVPQNTIYSSDNNSNLETNDVRLNKQNISQKNIINLITEDIDDINNNIKNINKVKKILSELVNINSNKTSTKNITIKSILFLMKSNTDITLQNLKYTKDILEGKDFISKNLKKLEDMLLNNKKTYDKFNKFQKVFKALNVNVDKEKNVDSIKEYYNNLKNIVEELKVKNSSKEDNTLLRTLDSLDKELNFMKEINKNMIFLYYPLDSKKEEMINKLYVMNKKKKNYNKQQFKIFFSLNTKKFNKVDIIYEINNGYNIISFNLENKEISDYFKENQGKLEQFIEVKDKKKYKFNFRFNEEDKDLFNIIGDNLDTTYVFDTRV